MVPVKNGQTQTVAQLFAIGASILAVEKATKNRKEIQEQNNDLFNEYMKSGTIKNMDDLSKAILADGQSDPKWKKEAGKAIGYQAAMKSGSVGAAGYNSFRSWCAKWYTAELVRITPEELKAAAEEKKDAGKAVKEAAEQHEIITGIPTAAMIVELRKRAAAGDAEAKALKFPKA